MVDNYEKHILGDAYIRYLPTIYCKYEPNFQIQRLKEVSTSDHYVPDHLFNYHHFPELDFQKTHIASLIHNSLLREKNIRLNDFTSSVITKNSVSFRTTITGRSGDGKTFLLYHLAKLASDDCFFIPIHQGTALRFFQLVNCDYTDSEILHSMIMKKTSQVLCFYLLELEKLIESELSNLEIMEVFNSGLINTIFKNAQSNEDAEMSLETISERIFENTKKLVVFVMDEAHVFSNTFVNTIPRTGINQKGTLLTAITRIATSNPIICCSTSISGVQLDIDIEGLDTTRITKYNLSEESQQPPTEAPSNITIVDNPFDFISYFVKITEDSDEETKRFLNILLHDSPVRISTWVCDEFFKAALIASYKTLSKRELLVESVRRVFTKVMPQYGEKMTNTLYQLDKEVKQALNFIWTGLSPHLLDSTEKNSILVNNMHADDKENFIQEMLNLGCGKVADGAYKFSDPFFRFAYLSSMSQIRWSEYEYLLNDLFNSLIPGRSLDLSNKKEYLFERVIALLLLHLSKELNGAPITSLPLFEQFKGTWLDGYTMKLQSMEHDNRFAAGLIYMNITDIIAISIDRNCGTLFFSIVPVESNPVKMKISTIVSVKFKKKALDSTHQNFGVIPDFSKLLQHSHHHSSKCLRINFVAKPSLKKESIVKQTNEDEKCIVISLADSQFIDAIETYMKILAPTLQKYTRRTRNK